MIAHKSLMLRMPEHLRRLGWRREKMQKLQLHRLRSIVRVAKESSLWHRDRLSHIDPDDLTVGNLSALPVMTKADVMDHWDHIVTDRRLTLRGVFDHVEHAPPDELMLGRYKLAVSSGTSGQVGIWPFDPESWLELQASTMRMTLRAHLGSKIDVALRRPVVAVIAAASAFHLSTQLVRGFNGLTRQYRFPVTLPFREIARGVNECQPTTLSGYPSLLAELAKLSRDGRLDIRPQRIVTSAEPLLDEHRELMEGAWEAQISNVWAVSEAGTLAAGCFAHPGMHLAEDIAIIEPMDEDGCPVGAGQTAQKVYLTSLINTTLPVIRYEMSDRIQLIDEPCPCGSTLPKIADLQERIDELFHYRGDTHVHMHLMRSALSHEPNMIDYQILQTEDGVRVLLKAKGPIDCRAVRRRITAALADAGVARPRVEVEVGARLWRLATGKLKRYVPLGFDGLTQEARA